MATAGGGNRGGRGPRVSPQSRRISRYEYPEATEPRTPETGHTSLLGGEHVVGLPLDGGSWSKRIDIARIPDDSDSLVVVDIDPAIDPVLLWSGKRNQRDVPVLPLQRNEVVAESRIARIVERARSAAVPVHSQGSLFADLEKELREGDKGKRVEFYTHDEGWKNKLVCGDSLTVMESLLEYEGEFHRSLQRSGHDGRVNPSQRPVELASHPRCGILASVRWAALFCRASCGRSEGEHYMAHSIFRRRTGARVLVFVVTLTVAPLFVLIVPGSASASRTSVPPASPNASTPTATSLVQGGAGTGVPGPSSGSAAPLRAAVNSASTTPNAATPQAYSPAGCVINLMGLPHWAQSMNWNGVKIFLSTNCQYPVQTLYISVSLYKTDFWGSYYEANGSNTNYWATSVGAGAGVYCSNFSQWTTFYGVAYSYSQENGTTYSSEGSSRSRSLQCGTPGG